MFGVCLTFLFLTRRPPAGVGFGTWLSVVVGQKQKRQNMWEERVWFLVCRGVLASNDAGLLRGWKDFMMLTTDLRVSVRRLPVR